MDYNKLLRQTVNNLGGGEDVIKDMQTRINKQSYTPIKEDGIWGEETQRAVNMLDDVTLQSINNRMIEDKVLKLNDEGNTDRATYQKYLSTHTTKAPLTYLNDVINNSYGNNYCKYDENNFDSLPDEFENKIVNYKNSYLTNLNNWIYEAKRVKDMKISDSKKHQYMSCLAANGGMPMILTGGAIGVAKELKEIVQKSLNLEKRNKHGGFMGVCLDSGKDMNNNIDGMKQKIKDGVYCDNILK